MIEALHSAIIAHLKSEHPETVNVDAYPKLRRQVSVPAVFIEVQDVTPQTDKGTEQLTVSLRFAARCISGVVGADAGLSALTLAMDTALFVHQGRRFGKKVSAAKILTVDQDAFEQELLGYLVWRVEWSHEIDLGESIWTDEGVTPTQVFLGITPEIGLPHVDDYVEVPNE